MRSVLYEHILNVNSQVGLHNYNTLNHHNQQLNDSASFSKGDLKDFRFDDIHIVKTQSLQKNVFLPK